MEIIEALCAAIVIAACAFVGAKLFCIRTWSCLILSLIVATAVLLAIYPISELLKKQLDVDVIAYLLLCSVSFLFVIIYAVSKSATDFER